MICACCGARVAEGAAFCSKCGAKIEQRSDTKVFSPVSVPAPELRPAADLSPAVEKAPDRTGLWLGLGLGALAVLLTALLLIWAPWRSSAPAPAPPTPTLPTAATPAVTLPAETQAPVETQPPETPAPETTVPPETQPPAPTPERQQNAWQAYRLLLEQNESLILPDAAKARFDGVTPPALPAEGAAALADLVGDSLPELAFLAADPADPHSCRLQVYTYANNRLYQVLDLPWVRDAAVPDRPALLLRGDAPALAAVWTGMEDSYTYYTRYDALEGDDFSRSPRTVLAQSHTAQPNQADRYTYSAEGAQVDVGVYDRAERAFLAGITQVVLYGRELPAPVEGLPSAQRSLAEVEEELSNRMGLRPELVDPKDIPSGLEDFLAVFIAGDGEPYLYADALHRSVNILGSLVSPTGCVRYAQYDFAGRQTAEADPRQWWQGQCCLYSAAEVNWVAHNILHLSEDDIRALAAQAEEHQHFYREGQFYYAPLTDGVYATGQVNLRSVSYDGARYRAVFDFVYEADLAAGSFGDFPRWQAELGYENIDGVYYWTLYRLAPAA